MIFKSVNAVVFRPSIFALVHGNVSVVAFAADGVTEFFTVRKGTHKGVGGVHGKQQVDGYVVQKGEHIPAEEVVESEFALSAEHGNRAVFFRYVVDTFLAVAERLDDGSKGRVNLRIVFL